MLLTEKAQLNIEIDDLIINFRFDFRVIENLYYALKDELLRERLTIKDSITPLELLEKLDNNYIESYLILILHATSNGKYTLEDIKISLKKIGTEDREGIYILFKNIIMQSLVFVEKQDENKEKSKDENINSNNTIDFIEWFNYYYTMSRDKLRMSLDEFYNSTPAHIKERVYRVNVDKKNTYISAYAEITKAQNKNRTNNNDNKQVEEVSSAWEFFRRI